jgi:hypothetical protein
VCSKVAKAVKSKQGSADSMGPESSMRGTNIGKKDSLFCLPEPVFLNVYRAQESILEIEFRQTM